jgi:hypothetical protein
MESIIQPQFNAQACMFGGPNVKGFEDKLELGVNLKLCVVDPSMPKLLNQLLFTQTSIAPLIKFVDLEVCGTIVVVIKSTRKI